MGNKKSKIIAEIEITEDMINKDIKIINSFEQYKREYEWTDKFDDYINYNNEYMIKECRIKINKKIIPFSYNYKFNKKGKYIIKYSLPKDIIKINHLFSGCNYLTSIDLSNFDTQNVSNMSYMFFDCNSLKKN